jgi:MFS family permease
LLAPFYPPLAKARGLDEREIGLVFSVSPLASILASLYLSKMMTLLGRKRVMILGLTFTVLSIFAYGLLDFIIN